MLCTKSEAASSAGSEEALLAWLEVAGDDDPLNPVLLTSQGVLLERLGRRAEAIDALETATALAPDAKLPAALLGETLARSDRLAEAEAALRRAIELDPDNAHLQNVHATVLFRMLRHAEARAELLASIERNGEQVLSCAIWPTPHLPRAAGRGAGLARRAIALAPEGRRRDVSYATHCRIATASPARKCSRHSRNAPTGCRARACPPFANTRDPDRPLVVGLLSGSFKTHPVGWLTVAGFETLDPAAFAIVCLAQKGAHDWIARRFRAWRASGTMSI